MPKPDVYTKKTFKALKMTPIKGPKAARARAAAGRKSAQVGKHTRKLLKQLDNVENY